MNEVRTRRHSSFPSFGSAARIASRTRRSIQRRVALQFEFRLPSPPSPNTMTAREASYSRVLPTRHSHFSLLTSPPPPERQLQHKEKHPRRHRLSPPLPARPSQISNLKSQIPQPHHFPAPPPSIFGIPYATILVFDPAAGT